jgi:hypothetical protein
MQRVAAIAILVLAAAGCIGSSGSSAPSSSIDASTSQVVGTLPPDTNLLITYSVPTCPPGARCVLTSAAGQDDYYRVSRRLTCSPAGGDYDDPAAVCRAISDIVTKLGKKDWLCSCGVLRYPGSDAKAVGYYNHGTRLTIPLDGCSLCNLPGIGADLALLLPGAQG